VNPSSSVWLLDCYLYLHYSSESKLKRAVVMPRIERSSTPNEGLAIDREAHFHELEVFQEASDWPFVIELCGAAQSNERLLLLYCPVYCPGSFWEPFPSAASSIYIKRGYQREIETRLAVLKRVLANRTLYAYSKSCLVNRLWVPILV